ncbi:FAD-dependent oxidoreductase [Butyrivibrio proteoclasticus]|uniref:FAD-dependent oxidoreductase n=1 Tax=Butyrivibrio proteoclasticus TaxID=43305 RepID=UPI00047963FD|nr:FAD-dependent oxidoreductase [Butyrivibrio proteoclasticus]
MVEKFDRIIIGAGLYGLYSALFCGKKGLSVLVLEKEPDSFSRATYINQARVHMGYHYPRSLSTAMKSAGYFKRFVDDYKFCIHDKFEQIYATSENFSWTNAAQFIDFCKAAGIKCDEVPAGRWFQNKMCDGAFLTEEYTYDAHVLRDFFLDEISKYPNIKLTFGAEIDSIDRDGGEYKVGLADGKLFSSGFVLNATYASVNQILKKAFPDESFAIKYELCEIILCDVDDNLKNTGLTVMDGPFFSIMPFGLTGKHSLTSVTFTPHVTSYDELPTFTCQKKLAEMGGYKCTPQCLGNCNRCPVKPESSWDYMSHLANKYMKPEYGFYYRESLFSMKPILKSSEIDDSRPTAIRVHSTEPTFISVLSGKINTVYDLDEYLM